MAAEQRRGEPAAVGRVILRAQRWPTNGHLIADAALLGYVEPPVLDTTYGTGAFWACHTPEPLMTSDRYVPADICADFRALPFRDRQFATVVYDPPYKLNGTPQYPAMDARFGTGQRLTVQQRLDLIEDGAVEAWRVADRVLLLKCMDQVVSGRMVWQTARLHNLLAQHGARLVDRFDLLTTPRSQPGTRPQRHARANYSTLLVFIREQA